MQRLMITRPDDWHLHLRDGVVMHRVVAYSAHQFARAVIMPNLRPPVITVAEALAYRQRILQAIPSENHFDPLMTLYLTESTSPDEIRRVAEEPKIIALKLYPVGVTTHSEAGISRFESIYPVLEEMERQDVPLLIHGEVTDHEVDIFDRERVFIERYGVPLVRHFPELRIVLEHVTTREVVVFVREAGPRIAASITAHHLLYNRNDLLAGGVRPHFYCLPVLKIETHRLALVEAATSGNPKFFLGTDSAPHLRLQKESACGCAGCFTAHAAMELYASVFEAVGALGKLEAFSSFHGADFYQVPRNRDWLILERTSWHIPDRVVFADQDLIPFKAGELVGWKVI